jgi:hypothetical protein
VARQGKARIEGHSAKTAAKKDEGREPRLAGKAKASTHFSGYLVAHIGCRIVSHHEQRMASCAEGAATEATSEQRYRDVGTSIPSPLVPIVDSSEAALWMHGFFVVQVVT